MSGGGDSPWLELICRLKKKATFILEAHTFVTHVTLICGNLDGDWHQKLHIASKLSLQLNNQFLSL